MSKEKEEKVLLEKCECGNMVHDDAPACFHCGKVKDRSIYERHAFWTAVYMFTVPFITYFVLTRAFNMQEDTAENISILLFITGLIWYFIIARAYDKKFNKHPYARRNF
ncbi:SoxR reducing system RseC family protein [Sulfurimonas sp.]|uniref:SoxR reducing system RseC family protein n=1 Tax=Sulfurimonas sp. TaxID=2022749 RepID=UPI0025D41874|nr:SoxR reducing system RseC family protein [Sulfurimonas sp.]MCK9454235.1 hypothetical protein [Sulfurimonas sp.]